MPVIFESIGSTGLIKSEEGQVREVVQKEFSGGKGSYNTRHETLQPTPERQRGFYEDGKSIFIPAPGPHPFDEEIGWPNHWLRARYIEHDIRFIAI
uniref:Uncharacterized protein n=1 Tax=Rhizophagus irregularis (strain DAOM 181602 / DAOM 197198 / MUCL 43194) TaxID=747089 RepID=U9SMC1_RHIID